MPPEIQITVNGEPHSMSSPCSITGLLTLMEVEGRIAVDVNGEIIPRSEYGEFELSSADRVEIVHAIGGG